jgi:hypothetical protein
VSKTASGLREMHASIPTKPGQLARHDYEYERNGVANLFMIFAPQEGGRSVSLTRRHPAGLDSEDEIRILVGSMLSGSSGFQKTIQGRANGLRRRLIAAMPESGWRVSNKSGGYRRLQRGNPLVSVQDATVGALGSSLLSS